MSVAPPDQWQYTVAQAKDQSPSPIALISLIFLGLGSSVLYLKLLKIGDLAQVIPQFVSIYLTLSILYLIAATISRKPRSSNLTSFIIAFAIIFRIILLGTNPSLSDDIYRYRWEGYVQTEGINPYRFSPDSVELQKLRNETWTKVNNKNAAAIYPPLMQMIHAAIYSIQGSVWSYKFAFLAADMGLILIVLRLLPMYGLGRERIIYYAWNPLIVVEVAGTGHHDVVVVGLLLGSVLLYLKNRQAAAVLAYSAAILCKFYPVLGVPFLLKRVPRRHWLWLPVTILIAYLPYVSAHRHTFDSLFFYKDKWRFNGFLFKLFSGFFESDTVPEYLFLTGSLLMVVWLLLTTKSLLEQIYWITGIVLLCAPTLFPWYLIWIAPFLCFFPTTSWLLLTCLCAVSYHVLIRWWTLGVWQADDLFLKLQYYPFYGMLLIDSLQKFWKRNSRAETRS